MVKDRRASFVAYSSVLLWIGLVFFLSSPEGASTETSRFLRPLIGFFFPNASPELFEAAHFVVRKAAHFTEYAILAILAFRACRLSGIAWLNGNYLIAPIVLVAAVAVLDEFNQSFEPSRTGSAWDSLLDCAGGIVAIFGCHFIASRRSKNRHL
ncbi:MAG: VanZ family protein [Acidobacteriota bacterium]